MYVERQSVPRNAPGGGQPGARRPESHRRQRGEDPDLPEESRFDAEELIV